MTWYKSKVVRIGDLLVGGENPIRIQSMTNTDTMDTIATVNQAIRMAEAGAEMVRVTAQGVKEAENLANIKQRLHERGFRIPLIADIHFNPKAAETAAAIVEKVRINPGNYVHGTQKAGKIATYSDQEYNKELEIIRTNLQPLVNICNTYGTAIRIGVNHGSLGTRIVGRYGDTVDGMVVSAIEYARIFESLGFDNLLISVKSSNTVMMLNAYRQLAMQLQEEHLNYPLHIGVTEAGEGMEGRMKSIAGIGAVLASGIGDTIRVSLTEDPELELPVANAIVKRFSRIENNRFVGRKVRRDIEMTPHPRPFSLWSGGAPHPQPFSSRSGGAPHPQPFSSRSEGAPHPQPFSSRRRGHSFGIDSQNDRELYGGFPSKSDPVALIIKTEHQYLLAHPDGRQELLPEHHFLLIDKIPEEDTLSVVIEKIREHKANAFILQLPAHLCASMIGELRSSGCGKPVILMSFIRSKTAEEIIIENCIHPGALLMEGIGQGLCIEAGEIPTNQIAKIGFGILQATRARITNTEYIACPSCGRTHFNIQQRLREVKDATAGMTGLKIALMGCIVNGPGEMADADYGYVGSGKGKITLYKGKEPIMQSVPEEKALEELLKILRRKAKG